MLELKNYLKNTKKLNWFIIILTGSMEGCAIATLEKCIAMYDDERPRNMIEVSGYEFQ